MWIVNNVCRVVTSILVICSSISLKAQNGDQILDGIGETGMVSRYIFNGDLKDWSRNNLHGSYQQGLPKFVSDTKFNKVLSFDNKHSEYLSIPKDALLNIESLSISTWLYSKSNTTTQTYFEFAKNNKSILKASQDKQKIFIAFAGTTIHATSLPLNKWAHLVVVLDAPSKTISLYVDNKLLAEEKNIPIDFSKLFGTQSVGSSEIVIGNSILKNQESLNALLHDFRIYRVPLTKGQITGVYNTIVKGVRQDQERMGKVQDNLPEFPISQAQLYNTYLKSVADCEVETQLGELPRLPSYLQGEYMDNMIGPKVRVIWPAPIDNAEVLQAGKYTITGKIPGSNILPKAVVTVKANSKSNPPTIKLASFSLDQISLTWDSNNKQTKFIENRDKFLGTLVNTDPNSFLYMFRNAFGQQQPEGAKPLGVWDSQDTKLRGHATGHYLTALAQAYAGTYNDSKMHDKFAQKMLYMVDVLYELSQLSGKPNNNSEFEANPLSVSAAKGKDGFDSDLSIEGIRTDYWNWGKGFISAYPPDQFIMLEKGAKYGGQKNQVWAPYYTLHKILAGLLDIYSVSGNKKALDLAVGMTDWVHVRLNALPKETLISMWNTYIAGEFGGMNETLAQLSAITKDTKYLKTAQLFDNIDLFFGNAEHTHGLAKNVDSFRGLHSNQHIPQIVGSIEMYRVSNLDDYYKIADNFWYKAVNDYMYSIGGVAGARNPANAECFAKEPSTIYENGFSAGGQNETCATYNMLKLTSNLFMFEQKAEYMDYFERALYNHILASVDEHTPANTYHVPLRPGSVKQFGNPNMTGFTCCNGTAIESNTKLQNAIYHRSIDNKSLYVNLYVPSILNWKERNVIIEQTTNFPKEDHTRLTIKGKGNFKVNVRVPHWAKKGFKIKINGKQETVNAQPGTYLSLQRNWKNGDIIDLQMPFDFHLDPVMDQQNIASLFYGPILLAAQEPEARVDWRKVALDAKDLSKSIQGDPKTLEFQIDGVLFKPFYDTYGRHSVYLDVTLK
ncbi:glycoside hydrolase family 127 protein [Sphingobacterium sp. WQ 366]|uniref:Glycoside hydrolase family 127 protein n=2 Tax=Sphingobacterium bovistauri TaxID=2781959 RepID=A0ABS7Z1G1_9SPHI|nr:glycoside hydrolase family 127 protein [Sphingobacterium bovistauri]